MDGNPSKNTPTAGYLRHPQTKTNAPQNILQTHYSYINTLPDIIQKRKMDAISSPNSLPGFSAKAQEDIRVVEEELENTSSVITYNIHIFDQSKEEERTSDNFSDDLIDALKFILGNYDSFDASKFDVYGKKKRFLTAAFWNEDDRNDFASDQQAEKELLALGWSTREPESDTVFTSTAEVIDNYYRGLFTINGGPQKLSIDRDSLIKRIAPHFNCRPETIKIEPVKNMITMYFPNEEDWLQAMRILSIPKTTRRNKNEPVITPLKNYFHTNDPHWYKLWVGALPRQWTDLNLLTLINKVTQSDKNCCVVMKDRITLKSRKYAFAWISTHASFKLLTAKSKIQVDGHTRDLIFAPASTNRQQNSTQENG